MQTRRNRPTLRYRIYSFTVIILLSSFLFADTHTSVKTVIAEDSLGIRQKNASIFASEYEVAQQPPLDIAQYLVRGNKQYAIQKNGFLASMQNNDIDSLGFVATIPKVDTNSGITQPEDFSGIKLNDLIPKPTNPIRRNYLEYPRFHIVAPILFTTENDIYNKNSDGSIDYTNPITEDQRAYLSGQYETTPVLRKLVEGPVLMNGIPGVPLPGELGNSYIVGHSLYLSSSNSPYKEVFKPLVEVNDVGGEFFVYDGDGRKLRFRVFENFLIDFREKDKAYALQEFRNRRVVTLQTCKVRWDPQLGWYPFERWIVRGELVLD